VDHPRRLHGTQVRAPGGAPQWYNVYIHSVEGSPSIHDVHLWRSLLAAPRCAQGRLTFDGLLLLGLLGRCFFQESESTREQTSSCTRPVRDQLRQWTSHIPLGAAELGRSSRFPSCGRHQRTCGSSRSRRRRLRVMDLLSRAHPANPADRILPAARPQVSWRFMAFDIVLEVDHSVAPSVQYARHGAG